MRTVRVADDKSIPSILDHIDGVDVPNLSLIAKFGVERLQGSLADTLVIH